MNVETISIDEVKPVDGFNPRTRSTAEAHQQLVQSIKSIGLQQPPIVRREPDGFKLVAGHRRYLAALEAGLKEIPCIIREQTVEDALVISVAENVNREDLDPVDEAMAFDRMRRNGMTNKGISEAVGVAEKLVTERVRILGLPEQVQEMIREKRDAFPLSCVKNLVAVADKNTELAIVCAEALVSGSEAPSSFSKDPVPLLSRFQPSKRYPAFAVGRTYDRAVFFLTEEADKAGQDLDAMIGYEVGVRFNPENLDEAIGFGCAIQGKEPNEGVILDYEFASELACKKIVAFAAEVREKKQAEADAGDDEQQGLSVASRIVDPDTGEVTEDPERVKAARKAEREERLREQQAAHAYNLQLGTELVTKFEQAEPTLQVLKVLAALVLQEAQDLGYRGLRYVHPAMVDEEVSRLKDGRTKTKVVYKDGAQTREAVSKFIDNARSADQLAGRLLQVLLANRYADERAVAPSNRGGRQPRSGYGSVDQFNELLENLDAIAKRKFSGTLYQRAEEVREATQADSRSWVQDGDRRVVAGPQESETDATTPDDAAPGAE